MKKGCVLLADSHQNMLEGIRGLLESMFEAVVMVADEKSLLAAIDEMDLDLAVVDLSMPVAEENHVARRLKSRRPELKVVILSVHDEPAAVKESLAAGALGFVLKRSAAASKWGYKEEAELLTLEIGHGIGLYHYGYPIINRQWSLEHPQVFEEGMTIAIEGREGEPGVGGVRLEDAVVVTKDGAELLDHWPREEILVAPHG